jgi:hypothetical protein
VPGDPDYYRVQAMRFVHVCLASVLNLCSPRDAEGDGSPLDKLVNVLFGASVPHLAEDPAEAQQSGVKTKMQLLSERQARHAPTSPAILSRRCRCKILACRIHFPGTECVGRWLWACSGRHAGAGAMAVHC